MKRSFSIFMAFVVILSLCVLSVAADEVQTPKYIFDQAQDILGYTACPFVVDEGTYRVVIKDVINEPVSLDVCDISFVKASSDGLNGYVCVLDIDDFYFRFGEDKTRLCETITIGYTFIGSQPYSFATLDFPSDSICVSIGTSTIMELYPVFVDAAPTLSGIVDPGMMSGVLEQVVSLLPVLIVTIITFIATRKGIAFLRGFLAGS